MPRLRLLTTNAAVTVAQGGSGAGTFTAHGVLLGEGTANFGVTAAGSTDAVFYGPDNRRPDLCLRSTIAMQPRTHLLTTRPLTFGDATQLLVLAP